MNNQISDSQVTINNYTIEPDAKKNDASDNTTIKAVEYTTSDVITNDTTFGELLKVLWHYPETMEAARAEAGARRIKEGMQKFCEVLGEDVNEELERDEFIYLLQKEGVNATEDKFRRPGAAMLRESGRLLTQFYIGDGAKIEVYTNGYAIYDDGDRKGVIWLPDCGSIVYRFTPLRPNEKLYMNEYAEIGEDVMMGLPWYQTVTIVGENRIEFNLAHEKNRSNGSDLDDALDFKMQVAQSWAGCARFENPEIAYIRKETWEERYAAMTQRQREVFDLHIVCEHTMEKTAEILGISLSSVETHKRQIKGLFEEN